MCAVKGCSNQSRLNKKVSYHKIPGHERKDVRDGWIRAIARPVLLKATHGSSDHFIKDSFDETQELNDVSLVAIYNIYLNQMQSHPYFQMERPLINQYHLI